MKRINMKKTYQVGELADYCSYSKPHLYYLARIGDLPVIDIRAPGKERPRWIIQGAAFSAWLRGK